MDNKRHIVRSIGLLVIFVMLVISSVLAFSYAYYASTANNNNAFFVQNTTVECLSITTSTSTYKIATSLPSYFYPISDTEGRTTDAEAFPTVDYTGKAFGQESIMVKNNCSEPVTFDVLFVPDALNQINQNYIRYALCTGDFGGAGLECWEPFTNSYNAAKTLGNSSTCYNAATSQFWSYMASTSIGGLALGGIDQRMCSFIRQDYPDGMTIGGNSTSKVTIRYWLKSDTPSAQYNGRRLSSKFVVYTMGEGDVFANGDFPYSYGTGTVYSFNWFEHNVGDTVSISTPAEDSYGKYSNYTDVGDPGMGYYPSVYQKARIKNYIVQNRYICYKYRYSGQLKEFCMEAKEPFNYGTYNGMSDQIVYSITGATGNVKLLADQDELIGSGYYHYCNYSATETTCTFTGESGNGDTEYVSIVLNAEGVRMSTETTPINGGSTATAYCYNYESYIDCGYDNIDHSDDCPEGECL